MPRYAFAVPAAILCALLVLDGDGVLVAAAVLVAAEVVLLFLPWDVDRDRRGAVGYWLEGALYLVPGLIAVVVAILVAPAWLTGLPNPLWLAGAVVAGVILVLLSRVSIVGVLRGDLAFLLGFDKPAHAAARATFGLAAPVPEEVLFRGLAISLANPDPVLTVAAGAAFVARHHLVAGLPQLEARRLGLEVAAAGTFTLLALGSGSIYPAIVAHIVNNLPSVVIQAQVALSSARAGYAGDEAAI